VADLLPAVVTGLVVRFLRGRPEMAGISVNPAKTSGTGESVVFVSTARQHERGGPAADELPPADWNEYMLTVRTFSPHRTAAARLAHLVRALLTQLAGNRYDTVEMTRVVDDVGPVYMPSSTAAPAHYVVRLRLRLTVRDPMA
jgi:hypothetical protein